jgi:uncharacterized coiled-coil protein SlyX
MDTEQRIDRLEATSDETRQRLARMEEQLKVTSTKEDIASLRGELHQLENRLIKWFVGTAITVSASVSTLVFAIAKFIH